MKKAFTLAETLIVIGIIGVVAALTIPNLISNYQKRTWTAQLQKAYSTINQGFRRMLADDSVEYLSQTETFISIADNIACAADSDIDSCKDFFTNLRKYFKIADIKKATISDNYTGDDVLISDYTGGGFYSDYYLGNTITLMDGTMITNFVFFSESQYSPQGFDMGSFIIDINGFKGPNKMGRDIFQFVLSDDGTIYPWGSQAFSKFFCGNLTSCYWNSNNSSVSCIKYDSDRGAGCAGRVLEEGKMNY
ncbi:type II secretion system protein [bacterium]|nr:type II secretion system protein [bacterium]